MPIFSAEIGQNHQGDPKIAREMIKAAAAAGADAVKFQKSTVELRYNKNCLVRFVKIILSIFCLYLALWHLD